jgi:hypothetical protein
MRVLFIIFIVVIFGLINYSDDMFETFKNVKSDDKNIYQLITNKDQIIAKNINSDMNITITKNFKINLDDIKIMKTNPRTYEINVENKKYIAKVNKIPIVMEIYDDDKLWGIIDKKKISFADSNNTIFFDKDITIPFTSRYILIFILFYMQLANDIE